VANELGVSEETVRADAIFLEIERLRPVGAPENRRRFAKRSQRARELYEAGLSMEKVADELAISERQVSRYLHRLKVQIRPAGKPPKYAPVTERRCPACGKTFTPPRPCYVAAGKYEGCCTSCGQKVHVARVGLPEEFIHPGWSANKRRKWRGKRHARKPPGPGARPRGRPAASVAPAVVAHVLQLKRDHPEWGERSIARATKLSRYHVGRILVGAHTEHHGRRAA
jgi:hypothetical protein